MSYQTISEILDRMLDKGIIESNENSEICCPDCVQKSNNDTNFNLYIMSSVETYLKFADAIGFTMGLQPNCCTHITASIQTTLKFNEAMGGDANNSLNCPNNYNTCINELKNTLTAEGLDRILDKGIVEYGSLSGLSQVCKIHEFIDISVSADTLNTYTKDEVINLILDKGIVISCLNDEIIFGSVETWLKWAEASGLTYSSVEPAKNFIDDVTT
jgi:hypothetical protein